MNDVTRTSKELVTRLRQHAQAWGVTSDTPDIEVLNETAMARECARAADLIEQRLSHEPHPANPTEQELHTEIERLQAGVKFLENVNADLGAKLRAAHEPRAVRGSDLVTDFDRGYAEGYSDARAAQPPAPEYTQAAWVPVHPREGLLWANAIKSPDADHPSSYPMAAVYVRTGITKYEGQS